MFGLLIMVIGTVVTFLVMILVVGAITIVIMVAFTVAVGVLGILLIGFFLLTPFHAS